MKRYLPFGIILLAAILAVGGGTALYRAKREAITAPLSSELASATPGAQPPHVKGIEKGAVAVTFEEFGDLQCPPCAALSLGLKKIFHDYPGRLRIIFRQFPLPMHNHAAEAARAAEAAGVQGRFWEMSDLLYENQTTWSKSSDVQLLFEEYAQKIGLDLARFKADSASEALLARIGLDSERGKALGVTATPTLFLNNQRIPQQYMNDAALRASIDAVLAGKPPFPETSPTPSPAASASPLPIK